MRAIPFNLVVVSTIGLSFLTSCAPDTKGVDSTKDSGAKSSDSTVTDLNTDELTSASVQQIAFSFDGVEYFNQWWTAETYSRTVRINDNAQPGDILLYMDLTDYTPGSGTWSVEDVEAGTTHALFEITAAGSAHPRLSIRELDATSGAIGDHSSLTSLGQGDEVYTRSIRDYSSGVFNDTELAYCKGSSGSGFADRDCSDCVQPDGSPYTGATSNSQDSDVYCDASPEADLFGARINYNDGSIDFEQVIWWEVDSLEAPTLTNLTNLNDGSTGGFSYSDSSEGTVIELDVSNDANYTEDSNQGLRFNDDSARASSLRTRLFGCTTSDMVYIKGGIEWNLSGGSEEKLKFSNVDEIRVTYSPSLGTDSVWNSSTNAITTYPVWGTPNSDIASQMEPGDLDDYCEINFQFRDNADQSVSSSTGYLNGQNHLVALLRTLTYRYLDSGSGIENEGLRTLQLVLRDEHASFPFAMASQPAEIDIAVYNDPTLTDATTATFFDGTPDVIVNSDYDVELTAGGTYTDGDPCYIASGTVSASTNTTITFSKANGDDLPEGTHTCTLTPVRTVTPTRVTDGETTSFDFTGDVVTFSLPVDTTAPVITIDTQIADLNGYTTSTTPTFDVTSNEAGTLTVGGSCTITGQDSISASTSTTITLDALTDGSTYSDCTVTVTDAAGNASNVETLNAFTVDATAPTITIDTEIANANGYTASTTPTFDVTSNEAGTLTVGGSCTITGQDSISASTSTTITLDTVTEATTYSDCTVTVTDAAGNESNVETLNAFTVDATAPTITIDTEIANANGYTASVTPTFDVTSNEAGTLTVGGSCTITGQDSISASTSTTITLDTVTEGTTYSDCTVTVTDGAGLASNVETLSSFIPDVTAPVLTVALSSPLSGNSSVTEDTQPGLLLSVPAAESETSIAVDAASTTDCALSVSTLTGGAASNSVTMTHPTTTDFSDGLINCQVDLVDLAGNTTDDTISFYVDQTAPVISIASQPTTPTLLPTFSLDTDEDGTLSLTGDCSEGSALISGSSSISDTSSGSAAVVTITGLTEASYYTCVVVVTDVAGRTSSASIDAFVVDTTSDAPVITGISNDNGLSSSDLITNDAAVAFTGTSEADAEVTLTIDDGSTSVECVTTADSAGAWTCDASTSGADTYNSDLGSAGTSVDYTITATAIDGLSNPASTVSNTLSITVDQEAPTLSVGVIGTAGITESSNPTVTLTSDQAVNSTFQVGTNVADDCAAASYTRVADTSNGNSFVLSHETTGGFADNTGSTYACSATVTDVAGNVSTEQSFTFTVTQTGIVISQSAPADASAGSGIVTSNTTPVVKIYSNTLIDTTSGGTLTFAGGCESSVVTLDANAETEVTLTGTAGAAFTDGTYSCTLAVNDGSADSNTLTLDDFTIDSTAPTISVTDTNSNVTTSLSIAENAEVGATLATVSGTDEFATTITYTEDSSGDAAVFAIDSATGVVTLETAVTLGSTYTYTVLVSDDALPTNNQASEILTVTVTEANVAPVLDDTYVADFTAISEHIVEGDNVGQTVSTLLTDGTTSAITDANTSPSEGIAIYATSVSGSSEWQYKDATGNWTVIPAVTPNSVFLLTSSDELRLSPSVTNGETGTIGFYAWDQTDGSQYGTETVTARGGATAYSTADATVSITVNDANDPPTMTAATTTTLTGITEGDTSTVVLNTYASSLISDDDTASAFATLGIAVTAFTETEAGSWQYSSDAGTTWSNFSDLSSTVGETAAFLMDASDSNGQIRFVSNTSNGETATLDFYAWDQSGGTAGTQVDITAVYGDVDSTYSASGSTNTFSLTVADENDAPVLSSGVANFTDIAEYETTNSGDLVSALLNGQLSDVDTTSSQGIAVYSVAAGNGAWEYSSDATNWTAFPVVSSSGALVLTSTDSIRFVPNDDNADSGSITYYGWDQSDSSSSGDSVDVSTVGNATAFSVDSATSTITVNDVNDQPVLDITTSPIVMTGINEGDSDAISYSASVLISSEIGSTISDSDTGDSKGIAITDASSLNGYWEYSVDSETTWTEITGATAATALLLDESAYLRFASTGPDGVTATLTFLAWDQSSGTAEGTADTTATFDPTTLSPFSADSNTLSLEVTDLNDAPELEGVTTTLTSITEDDANSSESDVATFDLSTLLTSLITDTDTTSAFNNLGIAVTGVSSTNGRWDYSIDSEATWTEITGVSSTSVLVLDDSAFLRFIPDSTNGTTATVTFLAWDQSDSESNGATVTISSANQGDDGAYSLTEDTFSLEVTDVNDRPVFSDTSDVVLTPEINEGDVSTSYNLYTILDPSTTITDVDDATLATIGVAITNASTTEGEWEYSTDSGTTWIAFADSTPSTANALLFDISDTTVAPEIRFNASSGENGVTAELEVYAWDETLTPNPADVASQNTAAGVASTFSSDTRTISLLVNAINDQPVLDITTSPIVMTGINEGDSDAISYSASVLISSEIGSTISDSDTGDSKGIAITDASSLNGYWEYSVDSETTWTEITGATAATALLLDESAYLRFASTGPDGVTATLTFLAWDQSSGTAEGTADTTTVYTPSTLSPFSVDSNTLSLEVTDLNDAPELAGVTTSLGSITENDADNSESDVATFDLSTLLTSLITDTDTTSAFNNLGIAVTGVSSTNGRWDYSIDSEVTWTEITGVSSTSVLVLDDSAFLRFIPDSTNGTTATVTFLAWDQSDSESNGATVTISSANQGDDGAYSLTEDTFSLEVTDENDRPVLDITTTPIALTTINEGDVDAISYSQTVVISDTISTTIAESDTGDSKGIAITDASSSNGYWEYSVDTGTTWTEITGATAATALLLDESAYLRFASTGPDGVTATLSFLAWDQTDGNSSEGTADTTATVTPATNDYFSADSNTLSLEVTDLNDAPELVDGVTIDLGTITEDDAPASNAPVYSGLSTFQVSSVVTSSIYTDTDTTLAFNNLGIAVTSVSTTNGRWEYSKDAEVSWSTVPAVSSSLILLLDDTDYLRFVPNGQNGTTATLTFLGWDQSNSPTIASDNTTSMTASEKGDDGAYSLFENTMSLTVDDVNDAPVFSTTGTTTLTAITEDDVDNSGQLVSDILLDSASSTRVSDVDSGAVYGIAVSGITSGVGTWQYNLNDGTGWQAVESGSSISSSNARLIPSDANVRFNPNSAAENGEAVDPTITYLVWDQTTGSVGGLTSVVTTGTTTAYSVNSEVASITVSSLNDAPTIVSAVDFTAITEDDNQASIPTSYAQVSSLISTADVDASAPNDGIAIVAQTATNGVWKYSLDTVTWGTVSISTGALLLDLDDYIAFVPNGENGGTSSLEFHAWDQYSDTTAPSPGSNTSITATGGTAAFSSATDTIEILVTEVNDAPVWPSATAGASFTAITEDDTNNSGDVISDLLALQDADADTGASRGVAIFDATLGSNGTGTWEYSTNGGTTWTALGSVSSSAAMLLRASDYLRFVPDGDNGESTNPYVDFYLWDGNPSLFGTTANVTVRGGTDSTAHFSEESGRSEIVVSDVNDVPVLTAFGMVYDEGETTVQLNTTDVVGNNADISIVEVDIGDLLTVELSLQATNWPFDPVAPDGSSTRTFVENNAAVTLDVEDTYGGTLSTDSVAWDATANTLTLTGSVASINADLQTLKFVPTAGLTPTDSATTGLPDFDLDTSFTITVTDTSSTTDTETVALTAQNSANDRPISIVYWDAYENQTAATNEDETKLVTELQPTSPADGVYIRVDAGMSWDPDDLDDVVSYTFTPNEPITANCGGSTQLLTSTSGCTVTGGVDFITHPARAADITWTVSVEDNSGQGNTVADLHDQVTVSIANQPPEVTIYLASEVDECSRAHATGNNNPVYADEDLDCFCDQTQCDRGSATCVDRDGASCSATLSATFTECAPLSAVYGDDNRGTATGCYCEELDCDGVDSAGEPNCFDLDGLACTPSTNNIDACVPTMAPNDFDFPYDVNLDLVACTYDANGDALNFSWSLSTPPALGTANFTVDGNTAVLSIEPPDINGTPGYFQDDELILELQVADAEDTITRTADMNFCAGWFPDSDEDGYGATVGYQANCANTVSTTFVDPIPANSNISVVQGTDYLGLDCLDEGVLVDDESLYGNLASVTELAAVNIQDKVFWYIDYDSDGYGATTGGRGDNGSGQFELTDGSGSVTDTIDIVYEDSVYACILENPSVTISTGETKNYLLNSDDCNDILDFSDGVYTESPSTGGLGASNQNPETTWYADIDGDGFAIAGSTDTSANFVYPDADFDCLCTSASGTCSSVVNNYQLVTGVTSSSCIKTGSLYAYKVRYQQCESPTESAATQGITGLPVSWVLNNSPGYGDCDETNVGINEGAQEACDEFDIDEDCDGLADDSDNNGTVSGALTFFVDNDGDGSPTSVGKVFSCDGNSTSGASSLVYYYTLPANNTTFLNSNVSGQCICPTDSCNEACRLSTDSTKACYPTNDQAFTNGTSYCAGITNSSGVFSYTKTPFDFTASTFTDFALFVKDCNDNSAAIYPRATEACDGVLNDCVNIAGGVPSDEVDFDNDGYVECEFDGSTWNGANAPLVGADCSPRDTNVYPNATNICDGQYNNCASWRDTYVDVSRECFCYDVDSSNTDLCNTNTCVDADGASCTPAFDSQGLQTCTVWADVTERYVDETGACYCDASTNQGLCDSDICHTAEGVVCTPADVDADGLASCTEVEFDNKMSPGAPANQIDNDGDCFVECFDGSTSWVGGTALLGSSCSTINEGQDCNDTSSFVYPGAIEVCDGQFNNCDSPSFSATGAPVNETDDDGDGFVECDEGEYMDLRGCRCLSATDDGTGNLTYNDCTNSRGQVCVPDSTVSAVTWVTGTTGYGDCADLNDTRYPGAPEICDGLFNDCENPLLDAFVGASGSDCFCTDTAGSVCVDSNGLACSVDTNVVDLVGLTTPETIGATSYSYQEVECYCSTADCKIDVDGDGRTDCLDENDDPCAPTDVNNDGYADSCITEPLSASSGTALTQIKYTLNSAPGREADNDGDNYVECNYTASLWVGSAYVVGGKDCNDFPTDNGDRVYPTAPEYCDGIYNDCSDATYSATNPPVNESDVDGDGYVECSLTAGYAWVGSVEPDGYADCVDSNRLIYPGAVEACDGVFNDCSNNRYSATSAPATETDNDGDGYVECADVFYADDAGCVCEGIADVNGVVSYSNCEYQQTACAPDLASIVPLTWSGDAITGYEDCNDAVATIYPSASEVCDGRFNDCDHPLKPDGDNAGVYSGVVGDCFCAVVDTTGDGTADSCDATQCEDSAGNACSPADDDSDGYVDNCVIADSASSAFVTASTGSALYGAEVDCYCPTTDCQLDVTSDAVNDCYAPDGSECKAVSDSNGFAQDCLSNLGTTTVAVSHVFVDDGNVQIDQPWEEIDNDGDGYVECAQFDLSTYRAGGGSFSVVGGQDCDDYDDVVYPSAPEYCDGQFNDCENVAYTASGAPLNETDNDGDGYVECTLTNGVPWGRTDTEPAGYADCDDGSDLIYPTARELCDGVFNDCSAINYNASSAPVLELDGDGDGYVDCFDGAYIDDNNCVCATTADTNEDGIVDLFEDCTDENGQTCVPDNASLDPVVWLGATAPTGYGDCNDVRPSVYPSASEVCDAQFNNCEDPLNPVNPDTNGVYSGVVSDCFCPSTDCAIDGDGDGNSDCVDSAGSACTPADEDADGFADECAESTAAMTISGQDYFSAEVDCYCPEDSCGYDWNGDVKPHCYTPSGSVCQQPLNVNNHYVDCASDPNQLGGVFAHTFTDASGNAITKPFDEIDNDGDRYVECDSFDAVAWNAAGGSVQVLGGNDCDDVDAFVYPSAPEYCDGQFNDCENVAYTASGAPLNETDNDGDGYVECTLTNGVPWAIVETDPMGDGAHYTDGFGCYCDGACDDSNSICRNYSGSVCIPVQSTCTAVGGYADCDDTDNWVFPAAPDLCDGQYNDCEDNNFSLVNIPTDESDVDGDGYVECTYDGSVWRGGTQPDGYGDCSDNDATTNGSAAEICDGIFNDCAHPQKFAFEGVVGDCYCPSSDCTIDNGQGSECRDSTGAVCIPEDADGDNKADYCNESTTPVSIAGTDFYGVEVECYCPSSDCQLDVNSDGYEDCLTPTGSVCVTPDDGNGYALTCAAGDQVPHLFRQANGLPLSAPMNETDHDGDGFVECEFFVETWEGPLSVDGGLDCNDGDDLVYPGATEYCDGQYNNCSDLTHDINGAPQNESDVDGDGYVECSFTNGVDWARSNVPVGDEDCKDDDATVYPGATEVCDGQYNNCSVFGYNANLAPLDETDNDGDGYVECLDGEVVDAAGCACATSTDTDGNGLPDLFTDCADAGGVVCTPVLDSLVEVEWAGNTTPTGYGDCQDANAAQYPDAVEECDGIFNNCDHPQKSAFEGVVSDCLCPTDDLDGDGLDDACLATGCLDTNGATCTPVDEDQDGYVDGDFCAVSTTPENQTGYGFYGAEVDCYCPSSDCQLDVLGNGTSDCVTPEGATCIPSDNLAVGYADACMTDSRGLTVEHTFVNSNGNNLTRPFNETDNDGDGFVECEYIAAAWLGSLSVNGGLDCDDYDNAVHPGALEVCDGQYNNCSNNYVETSAPANELDDDGDGWVECVRDLDVVWNAFDGSEEPNAMGFGTDGTALGSSFCICSDASCSTNCMDENGDACVVAAGECDRQVTYEFSDCDDADQYTHPFVALNEYSEAGDGVGPSSCVRDRDGDGYGDAAPTIAGVTAGHDCDDLNLYVHPKQNETCEAGDQVDSDCDGNVNTAVYAEGYILDTNGQGSLLYVDADGDGFGDSSIAATPACEVAEGFVFNATDCDDEDSTINPNSKEICDGIDQDCDLTIDEPDSLDDPSISKCTYMYRDVDADSYGDVDYTECLCQEGSNPSVTYGEYEYVIYAGDCYDFNADIKPLSCADGIDQDDDGLVDDEDPNCIAGFKEGSDTIKEEAFELLDGHDNNCDGLVAAVELDCDDDGSFPLVPGESAGFNRSNTFQMAADIGLEACSGLSATIECWGEQQRLVCDTLTAEISNGSIEYNGTGLWMLSISESDDGFGGRFDGGHREYPEGRSCSASRGDCDDQCSDRCPDLTETCDGVDNDCSNTSPGTDGESDDVFQGIPDAMIAENPIAGTISDAEIDIDSDGYLSCDDFTASGAQSQWSDASCDTVSGGSDENDCNNFCFFSSPNADERCDAFQGLCDGDNLDGTDADGDDMLTCGTWGADETLTEDIYVVVWMKDVDWSQLASEEQELIRPVRTTEDIAWALAQRDTADTADLYDTGDTGSQDEYFDVSQSLQETEPQRLLRERRDFITERLPIMNTNGGLIEGDINPDLLERMIPLIAPRPLAPYCDSYLQDQLTLLLGFENMEALRQSESPEEQADILLQACDSDIEGVAGCGIVRLSLSKTTDDETYEYLDAIQSEILSFSAECEERTEEWISRSMWQRERIVDARTITVEWECRRMYGQACNEISAQTRLLTGWEDSMLSPERWLDVDRAWFKEIGRYNPESIDGGTMMSCWGDPTDPTAKFNVDVGGDCADDDASAHRDNPEGPGDLVGLYLYGDMADCDTCLDGIDNNCDGAIDCEDPACAPCFVGQGVGCGGGKDSPCAQGGCASPDQSGKERMYRSLGLIMMAMIISIIRRRETRSVA